MIAVQHASGLSALMRELSISPQHISQAVNDRDLGLVDDDITRVVALRWFDSDHALLVDSRITEGTHDLSGVRIHAVMVHLAVWIRRLMPAGRIASDAKLHDVLYTVAKSFGLSVSCHPRCNAQFLYAGPWDGITVDVRGADRESVVFICGSFKLDRRMCELVWALDMTRYRAWFLWNVAASLKPLISMTPQQLVLTQRAVIEALCGLDWLHRQQELGRAHPAYRRWQMCEELAARAGHFQIPRDLSQVFELLEILLDTQSVVECTEGDRHHIRVGDLANYGDDAVHRRLRQVVQSEPHQFQDVLLELACAAWHKAKGHEVIATEDRGMPDLLIRVPGWRHVLHAECKRQKGPNAAGWLRRVIRNANSQFKRHPTDGYGVVYIDISCGLPGGRVSSNNDAPEIAALTTQVQHHLTRDYTSVSAVVLLWKQYRASLTMAGPGKSALCCLFWKGKIIRHLRPNFRLPADDRPILIAQTACTRINAAPAQPAVQASEDP